MRKAFLLIGLLTISGFFPEGIFSLASSRADQALPLWWKIKIVLRTEGSYQVKAEESSCSGQYTFTNLWTGLMERDDEDYILYHESSELIEFTAEEVGKRADSVCVISARDFKEKPSFRLNYILSKNEHLHFDFLTYGFSVPQNESEWKFYLNLPASKENTEWFSAVNYDVYVTRGSNAVFLKRSQISRGEVKENFAWEWEYRKWHPFQNRALFFVHQHQVKVEITITPRFE